MNDEPIGTELKRFLLACGTDPDKLAAFESYVSLLAARDESVDDGDSAEILETRNAQIAAARDELRFQLGETAL